jgi:hypothetical protein
MMNKRTKKEDGAGQDEDGILYKRTAWMGVKIEK